MSSIQRNKALTEEFILAIGSGYLLQEDELEDVLGTVLSVYVNPDHLDLKYRGNPEQIKEGNRKSASAIVLKALLDLNK